ncbi:hypothetical protein ABID52_003431 [Fictibacillus halophilus]|uniref:Uncharacterized protein n=1 Tax=Fictibacillus halophilus TaxID=1610490 RepID=A0ABV2LMP0_9BACL
MGRAVRWRLLKARSGRRLTVRPMESELPGAEINYFPKGSNVTKTSYLFERFVTCKTVQLTVWFSLLYIVCNYQEEEVRILGRRIVLVN